MQLGWRWFWLGLTILCAGSITALAEEPANEPATSKPEREWFLDGTASQEYRFRYAGAPEVSEIIDTGGIVPVAEDPEAETDHDLRLYLDGYLWETTDRYAANLSMGIWADLNGSPDQGEVTALGSIDDYEAPQRWHDPFDVYALSAEVHSDGLLALARGGRQTSEYGRPVTFDGATVQLSLSKPYLDLALFGGRTVHFFKLEEGLFEDWLAAGAAVVRPLPSLRLELDYRFAKERTVLENTVTDHSYGLTVWYRFAEWAVAKGYIRGLDDALAHAGGASALTFADLGLGAEMSADAQVTTLQEINEGDDPYFSVLGESLPHVRLRADVWKDIDAAYGRYSIHAGWKGRLLTEDEPTRFNRDFGTVYLLVQGADILTRGPFLSAVAEYHYTHDSPAVNLERLVTFGGSAGWAVDSWRAEAGTYFYRWRYDYYVDVKEVADERIYFAEVRFDPLKWLYVQLRYEFDRADRDLHTLTLRLGQTY